MNLETKLPSNIFTASSWMRSFPEKNFEKEMI